MGSRPSKKRKIQPVSDSRSLTQKDPSSPTKSDEATRVETPTTLDGPSSSRKPSSEVENTSKRSSISEKSNTPTPDVGENELSETPSSSGTSKTTPDGEVVGSSQRSLSSGKPKTPDDELRISSERPISREKPQTPDVDADESSKKSSRETKEPPERQEEHALSETEEDDSEVDPSEEPCVLEYTPPKKLLPYRVEDHFWEHKRKLIPDYDRMRDLDNRAKEAPETLKDQPEELVKHLTEDLTSDLEKTRVLIRWISENIAYVENPVGRNFTTENILQTRLTNCQGYSNLMEHFCRLAGVDCKTISGLSKGAGYSPGKVFKTDGSEIGHAWNKVKLQDRWYLCDPTWAAGGNNEYGLFKKRWREEWFLTHPDAFLSTHLPFSGQQGIFDSEQLVETLIYSVDEWSNGLNTEPLTHAYNIRPINYLHPVIEVQSAEVTISYSNPLNHVMKQWTELKQHQPAKIHENQAMLYTVNEEVHVNIRLPEKGSCSFKILGKIITPDWPNDNGNDSAESSDKNNSPVVCLFWYKIDYRPKRSLIPGTSTDWGLTPHYQAAGFKLLSPKSPILQAKNGTCQIKIRLPTRGIFPTFHRLYHSDATTDKLKLCVYGEKRGNKAIYHIRCPFPGDYRLEINYKPAPQAGNGGYYTGAAFLIECETPAQDPYCYPDSEKLAGPVPEFYTKFGLSTTHSSSTVTVKDGEAELPIRKTHPGHLTLFGHLYTRDGTKTVVQRKTTDDIIIFCIKPEGKGFYFLKIYAGLEAESTYTQAALYYVVA